MLISHSLYQRVIHLFVEENVYIEVLPGAVRMDVGLHRTSEGLQHRVL